MPEVLKQQDRWCRWKRGKNRDGKWTKFPDCSTKDPDARRAFADIDHRCSSKAGVGFITGGRTAVEDDLTGEEIGFLVALDYDNCRDPKTGKISPWAEDAVMLFESSYTEVSPSGYGLRQWLRVRELPDGNPKPVIPVLANAVPGCTKSVEVQLFGTKAHGGGYVTVTGDHVAWTSDGVEVIDSLDEVYEQFGESLAWALEAASAELDGLPEGFGDEPSFDSIETAVRLDSNSALLLEGDWEQAKNGKGEAYTSASHAFSDLIVIVMRAASGHGRTAAEFLLHRTAWGSGEIENSKDGGAKYGREEWVVNDMLRVLGKRDEGGDSIDAFDEVDDELLAQLPDSTGGLLDDDEDGDEDLLSGTKPRDKARAAVERLFSSDNLFVDAEGVVDAAIAGESDEMDDVLVPMFAVRKLLTNFVGGPKAGKTTFLISKLCGLCQEPPVPFVGFGKPETALRVLYFSENSPMVDAITLALSHPDDPHVRERFRFVDAGKWPRQKSWELQCEAIARAAELHRADIVVLDVMQAWVPKWEKDTSDQAEVTEKLGVAKRIIAIGADVALINVLHSNKQGKDRPAMVAILGSQAFRGTADFNLLAVRSEAGGHDDSRLLLLREGRNPLALVQKGLGQIPKRLREVHQRTAPTSSAALLCYEPTVSTVVGGVGVMQSYPEAPVPDRYQNGGGGKKTTSEEEKKAQEAQLLEACQEALVRVHSGEDGPPMVHRAEQVFSGKKTLSDDEKAADKERLAAALKAVGCEQESPGATTWEKAEGLLIKGEVLAVKKGKRGRRFIHFEGR